MGVGGKETSGICDVTGRKGNIKVTGKGRKGLSLVVLVWRACGMKYLNSFTSPSHHGRTITREISIPRGKGGEGGSALSLLL